MLRAKPIIAGIAFAAIAGAANAQIGFHDKADYPVTETPDQIAIGDWDGDGDDDLAITCDSPDRVELLFNSGSGKFLDRDRVYFTSGSKPKGICTADFDLDGDLDLAVAAYGHDEVVILQNVGAGAFAVARSYAVSHGASYLIAAALNGHPEPDLAVSCRDSGNVDVLHNLGGGFFSAASTVHAGIDTRNLAAADLDGDDDLDLAVASHDTEQVTLLANDGACVFTLMQTLSMAPLKPEGVVAFDLDRDGDLDLASAGFSVLWGLDQVSIFVQTAPGVFTGGINHPTLGRDPSLLFAADFDLDWDLDLAVVNENSDTIAVLPNNGFGGFGVAQLFATGNDPGHICGVDFDGNGAVDLVTTNEAGDSISLLFNAVDSAFTDLGFALAGTRGDPTLEGIGTLEPLSTTTAVIGNGRAGASAYLILGLHRLDLPFAGGTLVPAPDVLLPCVLDAGGGHVFQDTWPDNAVTGDEYWFQGWIFDPMGPKKFAATNALVAVVP